MADKWTKAELRGVSIERIAKGERTTFPLLGSAANAIEWKDETHYYRIAITAEQAQAISEQFAA